MIANDVAKSWILLNNEIMVKQDDEFSLHKDKEAVRAYFLEYVNKNTVFFYTLKEKIDYLIENDYYINFYEWYKIGRASCRERVKITDDAKVYKKTKNRSEGLIDIHTQQ